MCSKLIEVIITSILCRLEAQSDEYKLKCEVLEQDLQESQIKNIQLQQLAEDSK